MKRYISSILIPCLLLQLFGCYSYRPIRNDQIEKFYQDETIVIKSSDNEEYILQKEVSSDEILRNTDIKYCTEYELLNDGLFLLQKKAGSTQTYENGSTFKTILTDSIFINYEFISEIDIRRTNPLVYIGAIVFLIGFVAVVISEVMPFKLTNSFSLGGGKW